MGHDIYANDAWINHMHRVLTRYMVGGEESGVVTSRRMRDTPCDVWGDFSRI